MAGTQGGFDRLEQSKTDMSENPLGDREAIKTCGVYVVEFYVNPIGTRRREREGESPQGVVSVYRWVPEDMEYYRDWYNVVTAFCDEGTAREAFEGLESHDDVEEFAREKSDGDDDPPFYPE